METTGTLGELLLARGVSRRALLRYGAALAAALALPASAGRALAQGLAKARRPSVIWLSFQECTGCSEALTRAYAPTLEQLILESISLDYHHTLQAASGTAAEAAREAAMRENPSGYLVVVDGSVPLGGKGFSTIAGVDNRTLLEETVKGAAAVIAVGSCAAFGGLPMAHPNPTGAAPVAEVVRDKPVINLPGCPPIPEVMASVVAHFLAFGKWPELDDLRRPLSFYGETLHDRCYRRSFYDRGFFAESFDDEGARKGWCLFKLGCKGPTTYNACASMKWNGGVSFPIQSGHGCLGCSEPHFWDAGGFYRALSVPAPLSRRVIPIALGAGAILGAGAALSNRRRQDASRAATSPLSIDDLERSS
ncbi:MAG: hydrogenase small subunit [Magnetococcales bacterium]|nr:hydrogenase small subunit [Magnetococcales bacterium]